MYTQQLSSNAGTYRRCNPKMAQSRGSYFQVSYPMNHNPGHSFLLEDNEESFPSQNRFRNAFQQMVVPYIHHKRRKDPFRVNYPLKNKNIDF
jgi:hypothetical protein